MRFASIQCSTMQLRWASVLDPRWGAYSVTPDPLAGFKGAVRGRRREKMGRKGTEGTGKKGMGGHVDSDAQLEQGSRLAKASPTIFIILKFRKLGKTTNTLATSKLRCSLLRQLVGKSTARSLWSTKFSGFMPNSA